MDYDLDEEELKPAGYKIPDDLLPATIERREEKPPLEMPKPAWQVPIEAPPVPADLHEGSSLTDHSNDDVETYNVILRNLRNQWRGPTITCIDDVCKLSLTTLKVLEARRRAANKPLGADNKGGAVKGLTFEVD